MDGPGGVWIRYRRGMIPPTGAPFPEVQARAYASALILTIIVLAISLGSRWLAAKAGKFTLK